MAGEMKAWYAKHLHSGLKIRRGDFTPGRYRRDSGISLEKVSEIDGGELLLMKTKRSTSR